MTAASVFYTYGDATGEEEHKVNAEIDAKEDEVFLAGVNTDNLRFEILS